MCGDLVSAPHAPPTLHHITSAVDEAPSAVLDTECMSLFVSLLSVVCITFGIQKPEKGWL